MMNGDPNLDDRDTGLQVLVVGGSVGGLATAIALKAQGHFVKARPSPAEPDHFSDV